MKLVDVSVKRPVGVIMFVIVALVLGGISLKNLAIDLFPEIEVPVAVVITNYDGAAPQEIEQLITRPIESTVGSIEGVNSIDSVSNPGTSLVVLMFDWGIGIDESMNSIRERVDQVVGMLPSDASRPTIVKLDPQAMPVMTLGLTGASLEKLQQIADDEIQPYLERVNGVASVSIQGGKKREFQVELDQSKLALYGITGSQVIQAIGGENRSASAGNLTRGSQELQVRIDGEFTSVKDIENTQLTLQDGDTITVSDVATVNDSFKTMTDKSLVNGEESLVLTIMKQSDGNTVQVSSDVQKAMASIAPDLLEDGLELSIILDTSDFIKESINSVVNNIILGSVLSVIILLVFLQNIRTTLVIGLSIPIAIISTFTLMYFTGETLNILSMGGLALGLGMMVDSSIVILENIFKKRKEGLSIIDAAREGASELGGAVFAATMTTVVVFLPIVFVEGLASQLFRPLSYTVAFALFASLLVALTLIPMLSSKLLKNVKPQEDEDIEKMSRFDRMFFKVQTKYGELLKVALKRKKTTIALSFGLVIASFGLTPFIGTEFIPESDQGQVQVNVVTQIGSKLEETESIIRNINEKMEPLMENVETSFASIGGGNGFGDGSTNEASYIIQLIPPSERELTTNDFMKELRAATEDVLGAEITVTALDGGMGGGSPIQVNISGSDMDVLGDLAQQVTWILEDIEGTTNIDNTLAEGRPELTIKVNREVATQYGLSYQQVMNEISLGFTGQVASRYRTDGSEFDVRVMFPEDSRQSIRDLETLTIRNNEGMEVPLAAVAELKQTRGPAEINRSNQQREVRVTSDLVDRDLGSVMAEVQQEMERIHTPDGYRITTGGDFEDMMEAFSQLALALLLSIFLVYMVMAVQFESFVQPFIIMFSLPTMFVGVIVGLAVTGQPLSVPAFIGVIMLAGIVVNNAIVLVDYVNILRNKGMDKIDAIIEAGKSRLRPILMTTLTTALAMLPLALGIGQGTESQMPMAVVIIFGLMFSTVFTLVLIPVVYSFSRKVKKAEQEEQTVELEG